MAAKAEKETAYHLRHASEWVIRLGDGTGDSRARAQAAVENLWGFTGELFEVDRAERGIIEEGIAVDPASLRSVWSTTIVGVFDEATLQAPASCWMQSGGRGGRHSEHLGHLLSELQYLQRTYPGATW